MLKVIFKTRVLLENVKKNVLSNKPVAVIEV